MKPTKTSKRVPEDQIATIIERYSSGESSENIAKDLSLNGSTVCRILKRNNISIRPASENKTKIKSKNDNYFSSIDSFDKSYFLGLMFSDGNVSSKKNDIKISLMESDVKILNIFSNKIFGHVKIAKEDSSENDENCKKYCRFSVVSQKMKQDLIKLGCVPNKTWKITFPDVPYISHFIRGYLDGDGCISISKNGRCRVIFTCNEVFAAGLSDFIQRELDIKTSTTKYKKSNVVDVTINNINHCAKFLNYIYGDCQDCFIDRKFEKYQEVLKIHTLKASNK